MNCYYCVEDKLSEAVIRRLVLSFHSGVNLNQLQPNRGGNAPIRSKFRTYCELSRRSTVFILTDLDRIECAPSLKENWMRKAGIAGKLPDGMVFSVAVKEVEAWLIADCTNFSAFTGIPKNRFPDSNEIDDPKDWILNNVRSKGNKRSRTEILPAGRAKFGVGYNDYLCEFTNRHWNFTEAANNNHSLQKALRRISNV